MGEGKPVVLFMATSSQMSTSRPKPASGGSTRIQKARRSMDVRCFCSLFTLASGPASARGAPSPRPSPARGRGSEASRGEWKTALTMVCFSSGVSGVDLERVGIFLRVLAVPYGAVEQLAGAHHVLGNGRLRSCGSLLVDVDAVDLRGHLQV